MLGKVARIQRYSLNDGPGIRTTVFFKGCNLRCAWCANPELIDQHQFLFNNKPVYQDMEPQELVLELLKDQDFYQESNGGVTFSGGEPLLQADFIRECIDLLNEQNIHVALDTALCLQPEIILPLLDKVDLWLVDLKTLDDKVHQQYVGNSNQLILDNIKLLSKHGANMWVRCIAVNHINSTVQDMKERLDFLFQFKESIQRIDILGYHQLGVGKYQQLNQKYPLDQTALLDKISEEALLKLIDDYQLNIHFERGI